MLEQRDSKKLGMNFAFVYICSICYCIGVLYSANTNNTQDFQEQNCLENPNGLLTELCGQPSTEDEQGLLSLLFVIKINLI